MFLPIPNLSLVLQTPSEKALRPQTISQVQSQKQFEAVGCIEQNYEEHQFIHIYIYIIPNLNIE